MENSWGNGLIVVIVKLVIDREAERVLRAMQGNGTNIRRNSW